MEFNEMCRFILEGRKEMEEVISSVLKAHGGQGIKNPGGPPVLVKNGKVIRSTGKRQIH